MIMNNMKIYLMLILYIHDIVKLRKVIDIHYMNDIYKNIENMMKNIKIEKLLKI